MDSPLVAKKLQFEEDLKWKKENRIGKNGNKHFFWIKLQQLQRWDSIDIEIKQYMKDFWEENEKNPFDMKVANAMANENVSMAIKNNK